MFGTTDEDCPIEFIICNMSTFIFYLMQTGYMGYLLVHLCRKTSRKPKRSKILITATTLILYSSVCLSILFGYPKWAINAQTTTDETTLAERFYLILFRDLPATLMIFSHQLVLS